MQPTRFARGLIDNIGVKLIAVVVAMVIWFNASGQQNVSRDYVATLSFVNLPDSLIVAGNIPDEVQVSVAGTRRELIFMGFRKINMLVNMARVEPGRFTKRLTVSDMLLPSGVEPGEVIVKDPQTVDLVVERLVSKRLEVAVMLSGALNNDLLLDRVPEARPMWVEVTGAESAVTPLEKLPTQSIDLSRIRESSEREVDMDYDKGLLTCEPARVLVDISVSERQERVLANVPPTILIDDQDRLAEVFPNTVSLTLKGPKSLLDTLSSGDVSVLVDLTGKPPGRYTLAPEIIVPDGVEKYTIDVDSLRVLITRSSEHQSM